MRDILPTEDGSLTLRDNQTGETYHSEHGALAESLHIYIGYGLEAWMAQQTQTLISPIRLLEMGFGTGLNALLTWEYAYKHQVQVEYHTYELYPLKEEEYSFLSYSFVAEEKIRKLHQLEWNRAHVLDPYFTLYKYREDFTQAHIPSGIDLIYYDAFSPNVQPELWQQSLFQKLYQEQNQTGILTTYCAKGDVRRALQSSGYRVERLAGPRGKREVLRAIK